MFDIDGTLTHTTTVDDRCYAQALTETLGLSDFSTNWAEYPNVTDSGIVACLIERMRGRPAEEAEIHIVRDRFVELVRQELAGGQTRLALNGAPDMLGRLAAHREVEVAIATGGWRETAELKLQLAGLPTEGIPLATACDAQAREEIMQIALRRAAASAYPRPIGSVLYVGDAVWDVKASRACGFSFLGVGADHRAERLRRAGADHVIPDYADERFFELVDELT